MTDYEVLQRAKMYIDKMANGINPLTDENVREDDLINNVRISRCLFYVSGILEKVADNGGKVTPQKTARVKKADFNINSVDLSKFEYSETPVALSVIAEKINALIDTETMKKITYRMLVPILISAGMLEEYAEDNGKIKKRPTEAGRGIGISTIQRTDKDGNIYDIIVYNIAAQRFVIDNLYDGLK